MKSFLLFLVCLLPFNLMAQENFSEQILYKIIEHKSSFNSLNKPLKDFKHIEDSITGELKLIIKNEFNEIEPKGAYFLIDTFNFFKNKRSIQLGDLRINIIRNFKEHSRKKDLNTYAIAGYGIKENLFWIAIIHTRSNHVASYGFSIFGKDIKLEAFESGSY